MKQYLKSALLRAAASCGGGPLVFAIVLISMERAGVVSSLTVREIAFGIFGSAILAFFAGGISIVYTIERLPLLCATFIHATLLFLDYLIVYLSAGWIEPSFVPMFTGIYIVGYAVVWAIVTSIVHARVKKLNCDMRRSDD